MQRTVQYESLGFTDDRGKISMPRRGGILKSAKLILSVAGVVLCAVAATPARANTVLKCPQTPISGNLTIVPTIASNILTGSNVASIESTICSVISIYNADFSNPITVNITFDKDTSSLGSSTWVPETENYTDFYRALTADATSVDDATALTRLALDGSLSDPVPNINGSTLVNMKPANVCVLQIGYTTSPCTTVFGGTIGLDLNQTNSGISGSSSAYFLAPVVEHEIDEILGLGSTLGVGGLTQTNPSPEDFFRFTAGGVRSFTATDTSGVYFSLNGTTPLDLFNNKPSGGDYGDWAGNPSPQVQDAVATSGASPSLGVELQALDVIGYTRVVTPEPGTFLLMGGGLVLAGFARRRARRQQNS